MHPALLPTRRGLTATAIVAVAACIAAAGCAAGVDATGVNTTVPDTLIIVQGAGQSAQAGKDLPTPIVFRVLDSAGLGVPNVRVSLSVATGGGSVTPASDTTDWRGEVKSKWTLGPGAVDQSIVASVPGLAPVPVRATGIVPTQIVLVQGNAQSAKTGTALTNSIIVRVVGAANVPMAGVTVGFQVLTGGGGMSPQTVVTNALGEALTKWTVGAVGANTALVVVGALTPVSITATATP
jgi:hypothetical protein